MRVMGPAECVLGATLVILATAGAYVLGVDACAPPTPRVVDCAMRYQACVDTCIARSCYDDCRARVDQACLPDAGE